MKHATHLMTALIALSLVLSCLISCNNAANDATTIVGRRHMVSYVTESATIVMRKVTDDVSQRIEVPSEK